MATTTFIPVEEYLHTSYRPDVDYVDGELQERNLGEQHHSLVQKVIAAIFYANRKGWGLRSLTEQRVQVTPTRYRIPDVCVVASSDPLVPILNTPPLLCVEVLSPEDRFNQTLLRVGEFIAMGVPHVWIIDPVERDIWTVDTTGDALKLHGDTLSLPGTPVHITVAEIFEEIDEAPKA
jgi:Uma2 family endonuclease